MVLAYDRVRFPVADTLTFINDGRAILNEEPIGNQT
jgi:hypothetical protein